jgi:hypothetical protein
VVHRQPSQLDERPQVEAERGDVLSQLGRVLLEGNEDARLIILGGSADEEFHGQQRLAAAGAAADQGGAAPGQAAARDLVQSLDAGRRFRQARKSGRLFGRENGHGQCVVTSLQRPQPRNYLYHSSDPTER